MPELSNNDALENTTNQEFHDHGEYDTHAHDPELQALEKRAMEAIETVYQLLEEANSRDTAAGNSESAQQSIRLRDYDADPDPITPEDSSDCETDSEQDNLGEKERESTQENSTSEMSSTPEPSAPRLPSVPTSKQRKSTGKPRSSVIPKEQNWPDTLQYERENEKARKHLKIFVERAVSELQKLKDDPNFIFDGGQALADSARKLSAEKGVEVTSLDLLQNILAEMGVQPSSGPGLRSATVTKTATETLKYDGDGNLIGPKSRTGYLKWARNLNFFQPSGNTPEFTPRPESTRNFTLKDSWTPEELRDETTGRHPFIDPEVKMVLRLVKENALEAYKHDERYIWGCEYHPDDLKDITIDTLPSNGKYKPAHRGPEDSIYYYNFTTRLFASINTWIEKYIIPTDENESININSKTVLPAIKQTLRKLDYFEISDFVVPPGKEKNKNDRLERTSKRRMFFQYIFYQVLYHNIWSQWLYGLRRDTEDKVLRLAGLNRSQKNTKEGHFARGRWFTDNIRRKPTNMTHQIVEHQVLIATTLRQIFVPLLNAKGTGPNVSQRRMSPSAEKELSMIISDAQALQLMFQSEVDVHMIVFDEPGAPFEKPWMVNAAGVEAKDLLRREPVPGKSGITGWNDTIAFAFQPALFIEETTELYEHVVVV